MKYAPHRCLLNLFKEYHKIKTSILICAIIKLKRWWFDRIQKVFIKISHNFIFYHLISKLIARPQNESKIV